MKRAEGKGQKSEIGKKKSENQRSERRSQKSEVRIDENKFCKRIRSLPRQIALYFYGRILLHIYSKKFERQ